MDKGNHDMGKWGQGKSGYGEMNLIDICVVFIIDGVSAICRESIMYPLTI